MQIQVNKNKANLIDNSEECYIAGSINYFLIRFTFSKDWEELTKKIIYIKANTIIEETILDNTTVIPKTQNGTYKIGIVGFKEENNIKTKQISTNFIYVKFADGAGEYVANTELTEQEISTLEYYLQQITNVSNKTDSDIKIIKQMQTEINLKQDEFNKNVEDKTKNFNDNAELKEKNMNEIYQSGVKVKEDIETDMKEFNTSVENATTNFNSNVNTKTTEFNKNSTEKTEDYNTNAETKKQEINTIADGVKDMATAIQFATFEVTDDMELVINTADKLANTSFSFNEETGELEVEIND